MDIKPVSFQPTEEVAAKIADLLKHNPDKYESVSHLIRAAVIRLWREENENVP